MSLFSHLIDFAASKFAEEYGPGNATGGRATRLPCSGNDEVTEAIALGGGSLAQEFRCDRSGPRMSHDEFFALHFSVDTGGRERKNVA